MVPTVAVVIDSILGACSEHKTSRVLGYCDD